jgi:NADP-dependent 3-hydroxy acid dehydrogenase YdfG
MPAGPAQAMDASMDKTVIVTGAASGIGAATALCLARAGARVMLASRRGDSIASLTRDIRDAGGTAECRATDVADRRAMEKLAAATLEAFGRIDVLVNNAGVMSIAPLADLQVDEWDRMIDINLKGVLYGMAAVLPSMRARKSGHIITVASTLGHAPTAGAAVYSATKAAVLSIAEAFRREIAPEIRSTVITPGAVTSELHAAIADPALRERIAAAYKDALPAESVAEVIRYAIAQPDNVGLNEIVLRPTSQNY